MKIALIDNYDSFTFNLVQYFRENAGVELDIIKNDDARIHDLSSYDKIVLSPGPGLPSHNGDIIDVIKEWSGRKPVLGVCLGLQAIYESFGGQLKNLEQVHHGVSSEVNILDVTDPLLFGINNPFLAGRYHSWVCDINFKPDDLVVTSTDSEMEIMSCRHKTHPTFGVQFHPESILTPEGKKMIRNFVDLK